MIFNTFSHKPPTCSVSYLAVILNFVSPDDFDYSFRPETELGLAIVLNHVRRGHHRQRQKRDGKGPRKGAEGINRHIGTDFCQGASAQCTRVSTSGRSSMESFHCFCTGLPQLDGRPTHHGVERSKDSWSNAGHSPIREVNLGLSIRPSSTRAEVSQTTTLDHARSSSSSIMLTFRYPVFHSQVSMILLVKVSLLQPVED